jgi:hypothetical protein
MRQNIEAALMVCAALTSALAVATARGDEPAQSTKAREIRETRRLDLSLGDTRRYFAARELAAPLPDESDEEILVRGRKPEPLPEHRTVPPGLGSLWYALRNPLSAWRVLVPDPHRDVPPRSPDDPRDPPGAFRARVLDPGSIYGE